jgi:hypothetical protein
MKKIFITLITLATAATIFATTPALADDPICSQLTPGSEQYITAGCGSSGDPGDEAFSTVRTVLNSVYFAVSIAAVGVVIFGGFRYTLSQGDPGKVKRAKDTIMYAIIGLIVVLSAFAITNFILGAL